MPRLDRQPAHLSATTTLMGTTMETDTICTLAFSTQFESFHHHLSIIATATVSGPGITAEVFEPS